MKKWIPHLLTACLGLNSLFGAPLLKGKTITVDDRHFTGCFHNAFEGRVERNADGSVKKGIQTIQRTKGVIYGKESKFKAMKLEFKMDQLPRSDVQLSLRGIDDRFAQQNLISVKLNGEEIGRDRYFNNNDTTTTKNPRYFIGWKEVSLTVPAKAFKKDNVLSIENLSSVLTAPRWIYTVIDKVSFKFQKENAIEVADTPWPIYYYGLDQGAELNVWPAINLDNKICLVKGNPIMYGFFTTYPKNDFFKHRHKTHAEDVLTIETDADLDLEAATGEIFEKTRKGDVTIHTLVRKVSNVRYETPHPVQNNQVFIKANGAFENKYLKAWYTMGGVKQQVRQYPLRSIEIAQVADRGELDFKLSLWGGQYPKNDTHRSELIDLLKKTGFNFTLAGYVSESLAGEFNQAGFDTYAHYTWFGHGFRTNQHPELLKHAAINKDGSVAKKDYCPLAILEHKTHPVLGRYFKSARGAAQKKNIQGLCVDFEAAPAWCWCNTCVDGFAKEKNLDKLTRDDCHGKGKYAYQYSQYGRRINRDLMKEVRRIMKQENPELKYFSLGSINDLSTYWWDGRYTGRFATREMLKVVDQFSISGYFYNLPGGMKSVGSMMGELREISAQSGRSVQSGMISPLAFTISETPRYRGNVMNPKLTRQLLQLVYANRGFGLTLFRGDCFDGEYYSALRQGMDDLHIIKPYLDSGIDRSRDLDMSTKFTKERVLQLDMAQNLISRLEWRPDISYATEGMQLFKDARGKDRLLLLFNFSETPIEMSLKVRGIFDEKFKLVDAKTQENLGIFSRIDVESGKIKLVIPPEQTRFVRMTTLEDANIYN